MDPIETQNPTPPTDESGNPPFEESTPPKDMPDEATISDGIRKDETRLELLQEEYNTMADSIHDDFETQLEKNPSSLFNDDELELLASDSNIAAKNKMLRDRFESYRDEKLATKQQEIDGFSKELNGRKSEFEILSESNKFTKENPEADMEALAEFIQEDLTPRQKKELRENSASKYEFLKKAHELYKEQNTSDDEDENLPPDLSSANGASGDVNYSDDAEREAYLKSIGIGR